MRHVTTIVPRPAQPHLGIHVSTVYVYLRVGERGLTGHCIEKTGVNKVMNALGRFPIELSLIIDVNSNIINTISVAIDFVTLHYT